MSKLKIYISASHTQVSDIELLVPRLPGAVISTWHDGETGYDDEGVLAEWAVRDVDEVRCCDVLLQLLGNPATKGGRHTELGIALGLGKTCILIGSPEQVFHHHPDVVVFPTEEEVIEALTRMSVSA